MTFPVTRKRPLGLAGLEKGMRVLDLATGRGKLALRIVRARKPK